MLSFGTNQGNYNFGLRGRLHRTFDYFFYDRESFDQGRRTAIATMMCKMAFTTQAGGLSLHQRGSCPRMSPQAGPHPRGWAPTPSVGPRPPHDGPPALPLHPWRAHSPARTPEYVFLRRLWGFLVQECGWQEDEKVQMFCPGINISFMYVLQKTPSAMSSIFTFSLSFFATFHFAFHHDLTSLFAPF